MSLFFSYFIPNVVTCQIPPTYQTPTSSFHQPTMSQIKMLFTIFHIPELTNVHDWLIPPQLTRQWVFAPPTKGQFCPLAPSDRCSKDRTQMKMWTCFSWAAFYFSEGVKFFLCLEIHVSGQHSYSTRATEFILADFLKFVLNFVHKASRQAYK